MWLWATRNPEGFELTFSSHCTWVLCYCLESCCGSTENSIEGPRCRIKTSTVFITHSHCWIKQARQSHKCFSGIPDTYLWFHWTRNFEIRCCSLFELRSHDSVSSKLTGVQLTDRFSFETSAWHLPNNLKLGTSSVGVWPHGCNYMSSPHLKYQFQS